MLLFPILLLLVVLTTAIWLWRQGREQSQFAHALYILVGFTLLLGLLSYSRSLSKAALMLGLQLLAWGVLLWGLDLNWRFIAAFLVGAVATIWLPFFPAYNLFTWGFLTAVPLAALAFVRQHTNFPMMAPAAAAPHIPPASVSGHVTAELIEAQQPILECLSDGVIVSGSEGLIVYANQAAAAIIGLRTDKLIARPVTHILTRLPMLASANGSNAGRFEMNGRIIQGQMSIIYNTSGVAQGTVAVLHDMTAEYQAEKAKESFLTTISHELRTPLTAIKGYVELLVNGAGGPLNDNQKMFTTVIQRNVARMVQLINSLIFVSAIKGGSLEYSGGKTDLSRLIQQIVREMQPKAAESGQQIKADVDSRLPTIQADPIHMATILEELIANGIKYNRPQGIVRVSTLLQSEAGQQEFAIVTIHDEGIGIDPADQAHVFDDFYRPERREEQVRAGGMGTGLSIVRALIEAYNGRIWFESAPGRGSAFTFIIPTRQPTRPQEQGQEGSSTFPTGTKVTA